jgi:hypothetical protein
MCLDAAGVQTAKTPVAGALSAMIIRIDVAAMSLFIPAALRTDGVIARLAGLALRRIAGAIRIERTVVAN